MSGTARCLVKEVQRDDLGRAQRVIESTVDHLEADALYAATFTLAQLSLADAGARGHGPPVRANPIDRIARY